MQELVHDLGGHGFDRPPLALVEPSEERLRLLQLRLADLLGPCPQRGDCRHDVEGRMPLVELLRLGRDDRLGTVGLPPAEGQGLDDDLLEVVDVEEVAAVELADRGVEITRNREIDQQEPPPAPGAQRLRDCGRLEHEPRRIGRCDDDVNFRKLLVDLLALRLAVRDERDLGAAAAEIAGGLLAHLACTEEENGAFLEAAEDLLRERRGSCALRLARVGGGDIELGAVAGRDANRLASVLRQPRGERLRLIAVERNLLAQLDRRVVVRGADEDEADHAKWVAGRARRTTTTRANPARASDAARRPVQPPNRRRPRYAHQTSHVAAVTAMSASSRSPRATRRPRPTAAPSVRSGT